MYKQKKPIDVTLNLPQDLKDIGFEELRIKDENGIIKLTNGSVVLFPFSLKNYDKTIDKMREKLLVRKMDKRIVDTFCLKVTDILLNYDFENGKVAHSKEQENPNLETQVLVDEVNVMIEKYEGISYEIWQMERKKRYSNLVSAVKCNFPDAWESMEFVMTGKGILHIKDITLPFIGIILGNPSTYKTLAIGMLRHWFNTYYVDKISPRSFVSHANVETEQELQDIDLVQKIKDTLLLIPELSPIFMTNEETLVDILSTFIRLADGQGLLVHSGLHGRRGIDGALMFSMLGASVEIPSKVYKVLSSLGPKIYFYRTNFKQPTEDQLQAEIAGQNFEAKYKIVKDAFFDYLRWLEVCPLMVSVNDNRDGEQDEKTRRKRRMVEWNKEKDDTDAIKQISKIALFLSVIRGNVYAYQTKVAKLSDDDDTTTESISAHEYGYNQPIIENASRANAVLYNVARAHAFEVHGRNHVTREDIPIIVKIALSTANRDRISVVNLLLTTKDIGGKPERKLHTSFLIQTLHLSKSSTHRTMKELEVLGLVDIGRDRGENYISLREQFEWFLSKEFRELMEGFDRKEEVVEYEVQQLEVNVNNDHHV